MYSILIAEDEELERKGLRFTLEQDRRFNIIGEAATGREAVEMAEKYKPDIVLMDIKMPGIDGLQAGKIIREKLPEAELIILTAYGKFSYSRQAIRIRAADYLLKPVRPQELLDSLEKIINRLKNKRETEETLAPPSFIPYKEEEELIEEIKLANLNNIKPVVEKISKVTNTRINKPTEEILKSLAYELIILTSRAAIAGGADPEQVAELKKKTVLNLKNSKISGRFLEWVEDMVRGFVTLITENWGSSSNSLIDMAKNYINQNYQKSITLEQVASFTHLNPSYFSRYFKEKTNMNFVEYLTRLRLEKSKELLLSSKLTIDKIALKTGFRSNSYFTSVFKKYEGITPTEFRTIYGQKNQYPPL